MLQHVFKELYEQGILIFLDNDNYVTNNSDISNYVSVYGDTELSFLVDRAKFSQLYTEPVEQGWIFCYTKNLNDVLTTLKEDTCYLVEFGFNSDTEKKALDVGRALTNALKTNKFMANWNEKALKEHKVSTVITVEDLPESVQELIENMDDF